MTAAAAYRRRLQRGNANSHHEDGERGSVTIWLLLGVPILFAFAGIVLDGGRSITARQDASNLAEQAARTAVDQLSEDNRASSVAAPFRIIDVRAASRAACGYVDAAQPSATCSTTVTRDGQVRVSVSIRQPTAILRIVGKRTLTASGNGQARPAFGVNQEEPA